MYALGAVCSELPQRVPTACRVVYELPLLLPAHALAALVYRSNTFDDVVVPLDSRRCW